MTQQTKKYLAVDDLTRVKEFTVNAAEREAICRALVLSYLGTPRTREWLWERIARSPQRFSLAEFDETLRLLLTEEIIFCSNRLWWNREKSREKLLRRGSV